MDQNDALLLIEAALARTERRIEDLMKTTGAGDPGLVVWMQETLAAQEAARAVRASLTRG